MSGKVPKEKWSSFDFIPYMLKELEIFKIKKNLQARAKIFTVEAIMKIL